ncbi:hypothetical protein [Glycomyces paridis]|uniref:Uncharacterized protein n=1 Tax=Glycomyces paridis TaxID=2126555 RepID=A0A4S8PCA5_9ACTN|nr:hypothetical protein [Glycomyces paridis]THV27953.1 hypothetical protein E9998_13260 [Glycomyces paridis]
MARINLTAELTATLDAYAAAQGISRDEAAGHLITQALAIGDVDGLLARLQGQVKGSSIWELFPDLEEDEEALHVAIYDVGDTDWAEFEIGDEHANVAYGQHRGAWIYHDSRDIVDREGEYDMYSTSYTIVADEATARQMMHDEVMRIQARWTPGDEPIWGDCGYDGDMIDQLVQAGEIPRAACYCG